MSEFEAKKRDWFLTEAIYQEQMDYWPESNFYDAEVIAMMNNPSHDKTHRQRLSTSRPHRAIEHMVLRYSAGEEIESLCAPCKEMFEEFARHYRMFPDDKMLYWEPDAYQYLMWLLGLAYLFNLPEYVPQIATWYARNTEGGDDPLICALFTALGCTAFSQPQEEMAFEKTYRPLLSALQAGEQGQKAEAQKHLEAYLKTWYKGMKDCYWYNRHKGKFATHFGYWSFEAGLVSLLCGLDDAAYRDMLYYPKDLVDYARPNVFQPIPSSGQLPKTLRALPGERCPKTGDWYALHLGGKIVRVNEGDPMPGPEFGPTGVVIWHLKEK